MNVIKNMIGGERFARRFEGRSKKCRYSRKLQNLDVEEGLADDAYQRGELSEEKYEQIMDNIDTLRKQLEEETVPNIIGPSGWI